MSFSKIDIRFSISVNDKRFIDTQFCTHNLTLGDDQIIILNTQKSWLHIRH